MLKYYYTFVLLISGITNTHNIKNMKKKILLFVFSALIALSFSSCATIIGGAKYNAKVQVPGHPNATITVDGEYKGQGEANFLVNRNVADQLSITVQEENCEPETTQFTSKSFRGWAFIGTVVGWTGVIPNTYIFLPWGVAVDLCTGALWKPDENEKGVSKIDYDHYLYTIYYNAIPIEGQVVESDEVQKETPASGKSKANKSWWRWSF